MKGEGWGRLESTCFHNTERRGWRRELRKGGGMKEKPGWIEVKNNSRSLIYYVKRAYHEGFSEECY